LWISRTLVIKKNSSNHCLCSKIWVSFQVAHLGSWHMSVWPKLCGFIQWNAKYTMVFVVAHIIALVIILKNLSLWHILELSVKSCPVGPELHPSFDASSPPGCCRQSHEILLKNGMKYWNSGLNAPGSRTFRATVQHSSSDWLKQFTKRKDRANSV